MGAADDGEFAVPDPQTQSLDVETEGARRFGELDQAAACTFPLAFDPSSSKVGGHF